MARFGYSLALPPSAAGDVDKRLLTITVNGADPPRVLELAGTALDTGPATIDGPPALQFDEDDTVSVTLQDIDRKRNPSAPSAALTFTVNDDIPPPAPGELSVATKIQLPDAP